VASRRLVSALVLLTGLVLQLSLVDLVDWPRGTPALVLASVIVLALLEGPVPGMSYGFAAGLLGDLLSPHTLGQLALIWTAVGYLAGLLAREGRDERGVLPVAALGAVASGSAVLAYGALMVVLGNPHEPLRDIVVQAAVTGAYALVWAPLLYLPLRGLFARLDPSHP